MTVHRPVPTGVPPGAAGVSDAETALAGVGVLAMATAGCFWLASGLAVWVSSGRWPDQPLARLAGAVARFPHHLVDPPAAWLPTAPGPWPAAGPRPPVHPGGSSGEAAVFYAALAGMLLVVSWVVLRLRPGRQRAVGARWAGAGDIRPLLLRRRGRRGRLVLGRCDHSSRRDQDRRALVPHPGRGRLLATEARHSVLVIGPTQSGKTTSLAIPAVLEWSGPVVATSVKDDLAAATIEWRSARGRCWVFDPTGSAGVADGKRSRWSPLSASDTWSAAQKTASWLVESAPGRRGMADAAFWYTTAGKQLAPLLLAAQRAALTMADVVRWTDSEEYDEPLRLLQMAGDDEAVVALTACAGRDERIRSSVSTTLETVLSPFADPVVAAATSATDLDIDELITGDGTLYMCGPSHEQNRVQGVFAALVSAVVAAAVARTAETGRALDPPLLLVLDEAANIAPIRDLDTLASTAAGLGIQLVTVCQDLAQIAARYDAERARTIANNHRAKLLLSGVSDLGTLDLVSGLAGERAVREESTTQDLRHGGRSRSVSTAFRRLAPTDQLRRVEPGHGVLVYGHLPPVKVRLRPWFAERRLRRRARGQATA